MDRYEQDLDLLFDQLKKQVDLSFEAMHSSPQMHSIILGLWERELKEFLSYTMAKSQEYNDKTIFKTLTKALLFR